MRKYINAVNYNIKQLFYYEFVFKLITLLISIPGVKLVNRLVCNIYNIEYISLTNIKYITFKPIFMLIVLILLLIIALYTIFDVSSIILIINKGLDKERIDYSSIVKKSFSKTISVFKPKNLMYLVTSILFIPFIYIGLFCILFSFVDILHLFKTIMINNISLPIVIILFILYFIIIYKILYINHYYVLEDKSFLEAVKTSNKLIKGKHMIFICLRKIIPIIIVYFAIILLADLFFYIKYSTWDIIYISIAEGMILSLIVYILYYYLIKSLINDLSTISFLYYYKNKEQVSVMGDNSKVKSICKIIKRILVLILTIILIVVMYRINKGYIDYKFVYDLYYEVTAHRGASSYAPENTMAAFKKANEIGVDYIELDVHQTKDGILYVMHDNNLVRTTELNKTSQSVLWEEIMDLPIKSQFDEYQEEKIPLFEDIIVWAKENNVKLNIELKPNAKDELLPDRVIEILHKYNYTNCVIASFDTNAITKIHELDSNYEIVYLGSVIDLNYEIADYYSINYASITYDIVKEVHDRNKKIYAWTINNEPIVESMLNMGVDNIISNDPIMVKDTIVKYKNKNKANTLFNLLIYIL